MEKAKKSGKLIKLPESPYFKKGETYPLYVQISPVDLNDPEYIKMCEEWKKIFEEAPLPDFLVKRMMGQD